MVSLPSRSVNLEGSSGKTPEWVVVGLGSNLGDREAYLDLAREGLRVGGFGWTWASPVSETLPLGGPPGQGPFLNQLLAGRLGENSLGPVDLFWLGKDLEKRAGREPGPRWGPRTLDVDLLLYGRSVVRTPFLVVPHPRLAERRFVLEPLAVFLPQGIHPVEGVSFAELLRRLG